MTAIGSTNRGNYRKLYFRTREPKVDYTYVYDYDSVQNLYLSQTINLNQHQLHRDFYILSQRLGDYSIVHGMYEEDLVWFNYTTSATHTLLSPFLATPYVVLSIDSSSSGLTNIIPFLSTASPTSIGIQLSAPYSGTVRYRAVHATTYPTVVRNFPHSTSVFLTVSAGSASVTSASVFTASYAALPLSSASSWFFTPFDSSGTEDMDLHIFTGSVGLLSSSGDLSTVVNTGTINFILFQ